MPRVVFSEYRDQYENTKYPFADTSTLTYGGITIPDNLFLDAGFYFQEGFPYLSSVVIDENVITLTVTCDSESASCTFSLVDMPDVLRFYNDKNRCLGCIVSDSQRLAWFSSLSQGKHRFYPESTTFALRCNIQSRVLGVATLGTEKEPLYGDVWVVGDDGVYVRKVGNSVRIDVMGEVLYKRKHCVEGFETPNYLRTINGMGPDAYGNVSIQLRNDGDITDLRLTTTKEGIVLERI